MKLDEIVELQNDYVCKHGGLLELCESDDVYNNMNRDQIAAFKDQHGTAFLGSINFYGEARRSVVADEKNIYEEYTGQLVCNFGCDFCVPCEDKTLAEMIKSWNAPESFSERLTKISTIMNRIETLGGINFIWY